MRANDAVNLRIYALILESYNESADLYGNIGNLIGLLFHDLMIHFTSIVELKALTDIRECGKANFPFVTNSYAKNPTTIGDADCDLFYSKRKWLSRSDMLCALRPVSRGGALPFGYKQDSLARYLYHLFLARQSFERAYIPFLNQQIEYVVELIKKICLEVGCVNEDVIIQNWIYYINKLSTEKQRLIGRKGIVLGTRGKIENRIHAINYMQQEKKVVAFTHGEINNHVFDEPIIGYSERALCTTLVDYGDDLSVGMYNRSLVKPNYKLSRKSAVIREIYKQGSEIDGVKNRGLNVLYVPTMFSGCGIYGPFRQILDGEYFGWQRKLLSSLNLYFDNVTIKLHPKSKMVKKYTVKADVRRFDDCVDDYDLIVLDYYSTAATISIASNKPIIYFDIGLRNLNKDFCELLKQRVFFKSIVSRVITRDEIVDILSEWCNSNERFVNNISEKYSLGFCSDGFSYWKMISDIMK